jgi:hypothetical protein
MAEATVGEVERGNLAGSTTSLPSGVAMLGHESTSRESESGTVGVADPPRVRIDGREGTLPRD